MQTLFETFLVVHLVAFTLMMGTLIADFSLHIRLRNILVTDTGRALTVLKASASLPTIIGMGASLLLVTGIAMVVTYHGAFVHMTWFRIKMVLVLLAFVNGVVIGRAAVIRMRKLLEQGTGSVGGLQRRIRFFHISEILLLLAILVLSVFQF